MAAGDRFDRVLEHLYAGALVDARWVGGCSDQ